MKKRAFIVPLMILPFISACGGNNEPTPEPTPGEEIVDGLVVDKRTNYEFDESSTNENGSMSYEIFVRSFYDSDKNGIGDLNGVKAKLPYLADLGIKTIWLMPIHKSPTYHGYDVTDYYSVHSELGTLDDFDNLVAEANKYHIDVMMDMVFNHSSTLCSYFKESYDDKMQEIKGNVVTDSKANWYNWSGTQRSGYHKYKELYYEGDFSSTMPDFNLDDELLRQEIDNICKFWIKDHGVKGFRLDAVLHYYSSSDKNVEFETFLNNTVKKYNENFYMVGECWSTDSQILNMYKSGIESFFNFPSAIVSGSSPSVSINAIAKGFASTPAKKFVENIAKYEAKIKNNNPNGYSSYFLTNHDGDRATHYLDTVERAKMGATIYTLLPGTPFMYYGEEIELKGQRVTSPDDFSDVRRRLPIIWSKTDKTGECVFPEKSRQDLNNNVQVELGVNDRLEEGYSLLNHYKKLINVRNKYPVFKNGILTPMNEELKIEKENEKVIVAYKISEGDDYAIVITNTSEEVQETSARPARHRVPPSPGARREARGLAPGGLARLDERNRHGLRQRRRVGDRLRAAGAGAGARGRRADRPLHERQQRELRCGGGGDEGEGRQVHRAHRGEGVAPVGGLRRGNPRPGDGDVQGAGTASAGLSRALRGGGG